MEKFHTYEWNKMDKPSCTMMILSEEDVVLNDSILLKCTNPDIIVLPKKYEDDNNKNELVLIAEWLTKARYGKIIYV